MDIKLTNLQEKGHQEYFSWNTTYQRHQRYLSPRSPVKPWNSVVSRIEGQILQSEKHFNLVKTFVSCCLEERWPGQNWDLLFMFILLLDSFVEFVLRQLSHLASFWYTVTSLIEPCRLETYDLQLNPLDSPCSPMVCVFYRRTPPKTPRPKTCSIFQTFF